MRAKFDSLSLFEFQERFSNNADCMEYLASIKWPDGYVCPNCGNQKYCKGKLIQTRQCTKCGDQATPTSGTLFHKVKFPLLKAFYIIYFMSTNKKGISSTELSRKLDLRQKTCWAFRAKVSKAMESSGKNPLDGYVEVDEFVVGQQEEGVSGRKNDKKKTVILAIEKKDKGVRRMYARVIGNCSNASFKPFFEEHIAKDAEIRTDGWSGYTPFKEEYSALNQEVSGKKGRNFTEMHRCIMMLKAWLRGMHHSVSHLQNYLDEYCYRFNRSSMNGAIFDNLLKRAVLHKPVLIKNMNID